MTRRYPLHVLKEKALKFGKLIPQSGIILPLRLLESEGKATEAVSSRSF